jgi:hypothetical protein
MILRNVSRSSAQVTQSCVARTVACHHTTQDGYQTPLHARRLSVPACHGKQSCVARTVACTQDGCQCLSAKESSPAWPAPLPAATPRKTAVSVCLPRKAVLRGPRRRLRHPTHSRMGIQLRVKSLRPSYTGLYPAVSVCRVVLRHPHPHPTHRWQCQPATAAPHAPDRVLCGLAARAIPPATRHPSGATTNASLKATVKPAAHTWRPPPNLQCPAVLSRPTLPTGRSI